MSDPRLVAAYRDQIESLLNMAHQLVSRVELDALRMAIRRQRREAIDIAEAVPGLMPRAFNIGDRLIAQLEDADRELEPSEVAELEQLIQDRLDVGL